MVKEIHTGTRLELEIYTNVGDKIDISFISMFEQMLGEQLVLISAPMHEGNLYPVRIGWIMYVYFFHDEKLYMFGSRVVDRITIGNMSFLKIEIISDIKHIQRRNYFRFECTLPVEYRKIDYLIYQEQKDEVIFNKTLTKNISGGGACIFLNENIGINQLLECRIKLEHNKVINFLGRVKRVRELERDCNYKYETGVGFEVIEDCDKETIIKYIFRQQRKLRSKGLI